MIYSRLVVVVIVIVAVVADVVAPTLHATLTFAIGSTLTSALALTRPCSCSSYS